MTGPRRWATNRFRFSPAKVPRGEVVEALEPRELKSPLDLNPEVERGFEFELGDLSTESREPKSEFQPT